MAGPRCSAWWQALRAIDEGRAIKKEETREKKRRVKYVFPKTKIRALLNVFISHHHTHTCA
jgi:hypothetical protein